jgi:peptidoglycan/xylan/chitin deacetylase (PgdA/CDA1 family)
MRVLIRYWFVAPILLIVTVLQLGLGFAVIDKSARTTAPEQFNVDQENVSVSFENPVQSPTFTQVPTFTPTPRPSSTAPPGPAPTFTLVPTDTPHSKVHPTEAAAATFTPTPTSAYTATSTATPIIALPSAGYRGQTLQVPILMYHYLSTPPSGADLIRRDLSVSPTQFDSHLAYLREAGYETISFVQLAYAAIRQAELPAKPVLITFDDGYRDGYENAFPLLKKYGYKATFFIFTQPIETANVDFLSWDMVIEMHKAGMEFGSHSHTHPDLSSGSLDFVFGEVLTSKQLIEQHIGEPVRFFCYPAGRYDNLTMEVVKSAGFWGAVTTRWGVEHSLENRFELPRVRVHGSDTAQDLAYKLSGF